MGARPGRRPWTTQAEDDMEALRTQVDSLSWEIQRLEVENRKLRERNPVASEQIDLEAEYERAKRDVDELTSRLQSLESQLADRAGAAEVAARRALEAEERAADFQ